MEDGAFYLEDLDDKVELDLTQAVRLLHPIRRQETDCPTFSESRIWIIHRGILCASRRRLYGRLDVLGE